MYRSTNLTFSVKLVFIKFLQKQNHLKLVNGALQLIANAKTFAAIFHLCVEK